MWLVEMAISTSHMPYIWVSRSEIYGPESYSVQEDGL